MPRKHYKPEEVVAKLRQVDVLVSQGRSVADSVRSIGVTEVYPLPFPALIRPDKKGKAVDQAIIASAASISTPYIFGEPSWLCGSQQADACSLDMRPAANDPVECIGTCTVPG
jgi:hypothetical protein